MAFNLNTKGPPPSHLLYSNMEINLIIGNNGDIETELKSQKQSDG